MAPLDEKLDKCRLDEVVNCLKTALADKEIRQLSQRAIQAKVWHQQRPVHQYMASLRSDEDDLKNEIMKKMSKLIYEFHDNTLDTTLARSGVKPDGRIHAGSDLANYKDDFDVLCLDAKERCYLVLENYGWIDTFFHRHPEHFYENSFQFIGLIPQKKLADVKVKVIGLGIAGSMAVSGLAKAGVTSVTGYEKRNKSGLKSVGSRYQNASWRAYEIAEKMLDKEAYEHLVSYQQRLNIEYDDGTSKIVTSDRVQVILGDAIETAVASAERYGAKLKFGANEDDYYDSLAEADTTGASSIESCDIVALFAGAHTSKIFPGLAEELEIHSWPELSSDCKLWLQIKNSEEKEAHTSRDFGTGAENWHFRIKSARNTVEDVLRVRNSLINQYTYNSTTEGDSTVLEQRKHKFEEQLGQMDGVINHMKENAVEDPRFDYIFANAPDNATNREKMEEARADGTVVIDGDYRVDVNIASKCKIGGHTSTVNGFDPCEDLLRRFSTKLIVTGGDSCVAPNPLAAYGATLACQAANMVVQLAVAYGHFNVILADVEMMNEHVSKNWKNELQEVKALFAAYYDARGRSENYFQFVQTVICNLYSLPSMAP